MEAEYDEIQVLTNTNINLFPPRDYPLVLSKSNITRNKKELQALTCMKFDTQQRISFSRLPSSFVEDLHNKKLVRVVLIISTYFILRTGHLSCSSVTSQEARKSVNWYHTLTNTNINLFGSSDCQCHVWSLTSHETRKSFRH